MPRTHAHTQNLSNQSQLLKALFPPVHYTIHRGQQCLQETVHHILIVDKTALMLDRISTYAGRCPVTKYRPFNKSLQRDCGQAQKSSWWCTAITGITVAGDLTPFHFQFKSNAKDAANKQVTKKAFKDELIKLDGGRVFGVFCKPHSKHLLTCYMQ
eukprot:jgi/Psemu1/12354/gm1.12354_g